MYLYNNIELLARTLNNHSWGGGGGSVAIQCAPILLHTVYRLRRTVQKNKLIKNQPRNVMGIQQISNSTRNKLIVNSIQSLPKSMVTIIESEVKVIIRLIL